MPDAEYQAALDQAMRQARRRHVPGLWSLAAGVLRPHRVFRRLARHPQTGADALALVDPPADASVEHAALVRALRTAASQLTGLAARKDLGRAELFEAFAAIDLGESETAALEAKGYRIKRSTPTA